MRERTSGGQQQRCFSYSGQVPRSRFERQVARDGSGAYLQVAPSCRTTTRACAHRSVRRNARVVRRLAASVAGELVGGIYSCTTVGGKRPDFNPYFLNNRSGSSGIAINGRLRYISPTSNPYPTTK